MTKIKHKFIGRLDEIELLTYRWRIHKLIGVYGMRSIGKSTLIRHFLYDVMNFRATKVVWCNLRKVKNIEKVYWRLIGGLEMNDWINVKDNFLHRICMRVKENHGDVIIVFDNAEDIIEIEIDFSLLCRSIISHCNNVTVIITSTTDVNFQELGYLYFKFTLSPMGLIDAKKLMCSYAPSVDFGSCLETVVGLCEGLPLALLMVAAELEDSQSLLSLEDVIQLLVDCRLSVLSQDVYPRQVRIAVVYGEFLKRLCEKFQDRVSTLVYIPGSFTLGQASEIIGNDTSVETEEEILQPIVERNVIQYDDAAQRFDVHGILRDCINTFLRINNLPEVRRRFCRIFSRILTDIGQKMDTAEYMEALCLYNLEQQNFQKLLTDVIYSNEDTYPIYMEIAIKSSNAILQFMAGDGFQFYKELMRLAKSYGKTIDEACVQLHYGGALTNIKGEISAGECVYLEALTTLEEYHNINGNVMSNSYHILGKDCRLPLATGYQKIGWNLGCQGRHHDALRYLEKAITLERELNMYHEELMLSTIQSLGIFYAAIDELDRALHFHEEARKRRLQLFQTEEHPFTGGTINNIGIIYRKMGMKNEALRFFKQGLQIKRRNKATDKAVIISLNNVAIALSDLGRHDEATSTITEARELLLKYPGMHLDTHALTCTTEGQVLFRQGRYVESIRKVRSVDRNYFISAVKRRLKSYLRSNMKKLLRRLIAMFSRVQDLTAYSLVQIILVMVSIAVLFFPVCFDSLK